MAQRLQKVQKVVAFVRMREWREGGERERCERESKLGFLLCLKGEREILKFWEVK